jgi:hypothetical protein
VSSNNITVKLPIIKHVITEDGEYTYKVKITGKWSAESGVKAGANMTYTSQELTIDGRYTTGGNSQSSTIYDDGAVFLNENGGVAISKDSIAMRCDKSQVLLQNGDIYMAFSNSEIPRKIVPRTYKFHIDGKDQELTVLTFG